MTSTARPEKGDSASAPAEGRLLLAAPESFEEPGKGRDWHTAFYYLAAHVRLLSKGKVNHKELYSLVGTEGRYINHTNPVVRKRTAGALSHIIHTKRYVSDMRTSYTVDGATFERASDVICSRIRDERACDASALADYLEQACWPDVRRGLCNERHEWRGDLDIGRIDREMAVLSASVKAGYAGAAPDAALLAAMFRLVSFERLEVPHARSLVDEYPTGRLDDAVDLPDQGDGACLVRFAYGDDRAVSGYWELAVDRPFTIGRYLDCDIVETGRRFSRVHACVYRKGGVWYFEDMGSRNGSAVERLGRGIVFESVRDGGRVPFALEWGDRIVLAGSSRYWFGACRFPARP